MRYPSLIRLALNLALPAVTVSTAFAHPGHDGDHGGGLTWDFVGETLHRLVHPYHALPAFAAAGLLIGALLWVRSRQKAKRRE